ncbi:unnamed protein product [Closterium sp. NIES-53]
MTCIQHDGSSLYTLATEPPRVAASAQVFASGQVAASCSCCLLSHQTLLWHHRLGHPSLPRLHGMHSRLLVSGLPRSLPPLPPSPALPCLPCVEGRQRAAPHSSSFPPTTAPLQTLHMDVWGPARVSGEGRKRYFLLVVDDYTRYTTVFPLRSKGEVLDFLIPWIRTRRIGLVMEVARTSMIHAAAPHFLWPFGVRYAAHQLNLWPCVSLPKTSPTLRWTREVGDASVFRVWGSRAFVRDTFADKLSARAIPCDVTFDESVPFYHYRSAPPPPPPLFLAPGPPPVDPLLPKGPAPSGVSQVDPLLGTTPVKVAVGSGAARGAASGGAMSWGAEPRGAESEGAGSGGAEPGGEEPGGAESAGVEPRGAERAGVEPGGGESEGAKSGGAEPQAPASPGGPAGAGDVGARGTGVTAGAGGTGGTLASCPGGARTRGAGAAGTGGVGGAGARDPTEPRAAGAGGSSTSGGGAGGTGAGGAGAARAGAVDPGARGAGGTVRPRPDFSRFLSQPLILSASQLPAPSPYTEQSGGLTEHRETASSPVSHVRTARRVPLSRPPPVPCTHAMALRPSSVPMCVPLPAPHESSLPEVPDLESDCARAANPTIYRFLATAVTDPSFESAAASAVVAELLDFAAACHLDYVTALVAESASANPPSVGGECALGTDVLEDRQEEFECLAAAVPRFASMLLAPEGDPDAPVIPTPRSYAEAITGPYSSKWEAAMDAEMASWNSTGTYVDKVPPPKANIVDGMWILRVERPPGSPPAFKARYVARGFSQRQGVDFFQTFSPTPKMTTLRVLMQVAAQRDYELHSLDFSTAFLQGSLHEEIWLRRPPGFTGADPSKFLRTDTSLPQFYILFYVLQRFGFQFSSPQLTPLSTSHSLSAPPSDQSVEPSGPYQELVGCLITSGMGLVFGGRGPVVLTGHADASWVNDSATQRSSSCEAEIYAGAMAAQELCWLTSLLTDLGEQPHSPRVLYVDNKAMIALCQEHRLEHRAKQQRGQLRLAYVANRVNTADIFTKALPPGDHQRFSNVLGLVPILPHLLTA